jgi:cytochrome c oxidase subunit 1
MVGAKDLAFPKINLLSWYLYMAGGIFTLSAMILGGVDTLAGLSLLRSAPIT